MMTENQRGEAADRLWSAERDREPIEPLTETYPGIDLVDAYEIQLLNIARLTSAGAVIMGHKVGLSSAAMQQMMGVDEPDYGHLLDGMVFDESTPIAAGRFCYPRVEVEVGYVLGAPLPGEDCTRDDVLAATEWLVPSLELIDSRIRNWRIALADTIADNASSAGVILGSARVAPDRVDPADIGAVLYRNGEEIAAGNTSAVLGDPTEAVAWLARKVAGFGVKLEAGHVILPGSCTRAIDAHPGDAFRADFTGLGSVFATFC